MPRKARITSPGILQHIMSRGIDGRDLFVEEGDRCFFLELLSRALSVSGYKCYAWVLMPNHYHLLVRTSDYPLGEMMRPLNSTYARYYARTHSRRGYLFQDRYKSIASQDQNYCEELLRYIHLNPLRAKLCDSVEQLDAWPWSGHAAIMGRIPNDFQDITAVLRRFGRATTEAREKYRQFIEDGIQRIDHELIETVRANNQGKENVHHTGCWVIGDPAFVRKVIESDQKRRVRLAAYTRTGRSLGDIASRVAEETGLTVEEILRRSRLTRGAQARKAFAFICRRIYEYPVAEIGRYLGITGPAASICIRKGAEAVEKLNLRHWLKEAAGK